MNPHQYLSRSVSTNGEPGTGAWGGRLVRPTAGPASLATRYAPRGDLLEFEPTTGQPEASTYRPALEAIREASAGTAYRWTSSSSSGSPAPGGASTNLRPSTTARTTADVHDQDSWNSQTRSTSTASPGVGGQRSLLCLRRKPALPQRWVASVIKHKVEWEVLNYERSITRETHSVSDL